jgi:hypothetical protein
MKEEDIMRQAGLTTYQSRVYLTLRKQSGLTPSELAYRSGVPHSKIYEALYALEKLGLTKRHLNRTKDAEVDRKINDFLTEMKSCHVILRAFGRARIKQVWSTNGVSPASLIDRKIKKLEEIKQKILTYEGSKSV